MLIRPINVYQQKRESEVEMESKIKLITHYEITLTL